MTSPTLPNTWLDKIVDEDCTPIIEDGKVTGNILTKAAVAKILSHERQAVLEGKIEELKAVKEATVEPVTYQYEDGSRVHLEQRIRQLEKET